MSSPYPYRKMRQTASASLPLAIARNAHRMRARIRRMRAAEERVIAALRSEPPIGIKKPDWIARKLNEA